MSEQGDIGRLVLGRYRIVRRIAKGGMGTIDLARSEGAAGFARPVVVKRIRPGALDEGTATRLFQREARIMAHLRHPNTVDVIDFARDDEGGYTMVLEYVHGYHLAKWCYYVRKTHGRFPVEPAVHIVISVLDALSHAHELKAPDGTSLRVVHRDVKPANVLIDVEGHVLLTDFGIAQMSTDQTVSAGDRGAVRGTFPYMPPELFESAEPSPTSDTYACAVVLHEVLAGRNEFRVKDASLTIARVLRHRPARLDELRADVAPELADVIERALAKNPADRYRDAAALADALRGARQKSAEEAQHELAERARADFRAPRFAQLLGADDLDTLDRAWREETPPAPSSGDDDAAWMAQPTAPVASREEGDASRDTRAAPKPRRLGVRAGLAALAAVAVLVAGVFAAIWIRSGDGDAHYILVSGDVEAEGGRVAEHEGAEAEPEESGEVREAPEDAGEGEVGGEEPSATSEEETSEERGEGATSAGRETDEFTRAFREQSAAIRRCFDEHADDAVGAPELSVRFDIGPEGEVQSAELAPAEAMATPLGGCVLDVAKRTNFQPPGEALRVRIPIAVTSR